MSHSQLGRNFEIRIESCSPDDYLFSSMHLREGLSEPFAAAVELLASQPETPIDDLVGRSAVIKMRDPEGQGGADRYLHGLISSAAEFETNDDYTRFRLRLVPWLWLLSRSSDCRIHQNLTIPDIVKSVFDEYGLMDYEFEIERTYPVLEYCVQYRESHLAFVSRLLERAGIGYRFEHDEKRHRLVLFDDQTPTLDVANGATALYRSSEKSEPAPGEVWGWQAERRYRPSEVALTDYNFEDPMLDLNCKKRCNAPARGNERFERFHYPGYHGSLSDGDHEARLWAEIEDCASYKISASSQRGDMLPGRQFKLSGHPGSSWDGEYRVCAIDHHALQSYGTDAEPGESYSNTFTCQPTEIPFRPRRSTPRPSISGAQTATVVGTKGAEIDVDEYGRVVVQFHWDRHGERDERSSCRVRVAHNGAGRGFGGISHPRIGQEVVVEFLEGDPDRPVVTGRLYNALQNVPWALPANATQGGIRSLSSPGGGRDNFNEIRFEDKTGAEEVSMQAERNMSRLIKNDESDVVGNDRSRSVANDETIEIGANRSVCIGANDTLEVAGSAAENVTGAKSIHVGSTLSIDAGSSISLTCGASSITMNSAGIISISGTMIAIAGAANASLTAPITNVTGAVMLTNSGAVNLVQGVVTRVAGSSLAHVGGAKAEVVGGNETVIQGGTVKIN